MEGLIPEGKRAGPGNSHTTSTNLRDSKDEGMLRAYVSGAILDILCALTHPSPPQLYETLLYSFYKRGNRG